MRQTISIPVAEKRTEYLLKHLKPSRKILQGKIWIKETHFRCQCGAGAGSRTGTENPIRTGYRPHFSGQCFDPKVRNEEAIEVHFEERISNFAHFAKFESISARDDVAPLSIDRNFANRPNSKKYVEFWPNNFQVSRNFTEVLAGDVHPLSPLFMNRFISYCRSGKMAKERISHCVRIWSEDNEGPAKQR
jgi:hypothetical protein